MPADTANRTPVVEISKIQRGADAIGRAFTHECSKLNPIERRELLMQSREWLAGRIASMDEARRRSQAAVIVEPTKDEANVVATVGKGCRSSDLMAA